MQEQKILESWKEIAAHLRRSVATCQRWETELKLPVHRLDGTPKARVFAYVEEIDRWMAEMRHSSEAAPAAPAELHRRKNKKLVVAAGAVIVIAAIGVLTWRLVLLKTVPLQPPKKENPAGPVKAGLGRERAVDLGRITTRNPEALQYYIEGCKLLLWPSGSEGWREARSLLSKAIAIDPGFAMAYSTLGWTFGPGEEQTKNSRKALELGDAVSPRERLIIQGNYYSRVEKDPQKAIQAYKKSLKIYPADDWVNQEIASQYSRIRDFQNAFEHRRILYEKNKTDRIQIRQYVSICENIGYYDKGIEAYRYYLDHATEDTEMRRRLYDLYWRSGKYEQALDEADRLRAAGADRDVERIFPLYLMGNFAAAEQLCQDYLRRGVGGWASHDWLQNIYITQGQLEKAKQQAILGLQEEEESVKSGKVNEPHGRCCLHLRLSGLYLIEGKLVEALKEAEEAERVATDFKNSQYQHDASLAQAEIYLEMKHYEKAQEIVEKFRELMKPDLRDYFYLTYHYLAGEIELKKGNLAKAIEFHKKAQALDVNYSMAGTTRHIAALALAYYQAGNLRAARREREKIPLITVGRCFDGYLFAMNFYMLGKICEQQGERAKAIENYGKFLDMWKDADPIFPEVEDAKTRLTRLESH